MITLYHCRGARSFRPLWALEELGLEYDLKLLPFPPRFRAREFLNENPLGTIPLLVDGDTRVLTAVLAHELGHVQQRHGLRMVVQASALGAVAGVVLGDFSTLLAALPALMGQAHYSRTAEREADAHALQVLTAARIPPAVMVTLFDKLKASRAVDLEKAQGAAHKDAPNEKADPKTDDEQAQANARVKQVSQSLSWLGIAFASHPADAERVAYFLGKGR